MRIFHLGDLHLGKIVNGYLMLDDQAYILDVIIDLVKQHQPETIIIAGDVYDKRNPSDQASKLFNDFLIKLANLKLNILIISGNHDSGIKLEFGRKLLANSNIHIVGSYQGSLDKVVLKDEYGFINFYLMPFVRIGDVKMYDDSVDSYNAAILSALKQANIDYSQRNIFVGHQFFSSGTEERADSEVISVGGIDNVNYQMLLDFDYAALGHLHKPQQLGSKYIRYSGSPLVFSKSEVNTPKSLVMIDIKNKNEVEVELLALKPQREFISVKGFFEEIMADETINSEAYIFITLVDDEEIINVINKLKNKFPYLMSLEFDNKRSQKLLDLDQVAKSSSVDPLILFSDFYYEVNNQTLNANQLEIVKTIMERIKNDAAN